MSSNAGKDGAPRLNVLHIIADQHQAACMGCEGHAQAITPNLDRLGAEAVRFTRAYTQNPICTPSRVSIMSGQYCHNHGYYGLCGPRPEALPSFFSHFKAHGYRTAGIGNLHTPDVPRNWLETHLDNFADTFESADGVREQTRWFDEIRAKGLLDKEEFHLHWSGRGEEARDTPSQLPFEFSQEGWCVREAMRFIDDCRGQPFCMQVSLERPHDPCTPAREFWDMYDDDLDLPANFHNDCGHRPPHFRDMHDRWRGAGGEEFIRKAKRRWKSYLASITHVDHAVGGLLDYLQRSGLAERTIVIYDADHGGYMSTFGIHEKAPGICSEAVCRVPFIWRVPGVTPRGRACEQLVENVDIAPTIIALCGLPPMQSADGKDISALLAGGSEPVREIAVTENPHSKAVRWRQWRFVHYQPGTFGHEDVGELYDGRADPDETHNLYHDPKHQDVVNQCRRLLLEWLIRTTRIRTALGVLDVDWSGHPPIYHDGGDGRLPTNMHWGVSLYE
ncbi:MAG TPA: sulfatase-like hydrolase/transferase [Phycisphaerae bacterium]|nr:sulfatase-like hydrolase/transferase [Phycisphaerae bacterium]